MSLYKIIAIFLIAAGSFGLIYGGFNYTKETHQAELGPLSLSIDEKEYVAVPLWIGIASIVVGVALLVLPRNI